MKRNSTIIVKIIPVLTVLGLLTACGRGGETGTANTSDYEANTTVSTEFEYLGTEEYEIKGNHHAPLTDEEKQEKYRRYLKEVLSNK